MTARLALLVFAAAASFGQLAAPATLAVAEEVPTAVFEPAGDQGLGQPAAGEDLFGSDSPDAAQPPQLDPAPQPAGPPALATPVVQPRHPGVALFYFFSPDWRPPDFSKLAFAVERALASGAVDVSFQAFTRYEDFERQVRIQPPAFMIAPAWLESVGPAALGTSFTVIARPVRHGRNSYRKALMTRSNADSIDDLARGSIATTLHSMGAGDPSAVLDAFHLAPGSARIVPVPKDIDALLALSFGQVDAALVTSEQYEQLARTSPAEAERLRVLAFSSDIGLPPVFASPSADADLRSRLIAVLGRLRDVPNGGETLTMLGFDGFVSEETLIAQREARTDQTEAVRAAAAAAAAIAGKTIDGKPAPPKAKPKAVAKPARPAKKTRSGHHR